MQVDTDIRRVTNDEGFSFEFDQEYNCIRVSPHYPANYEKNCEDALAELKARLCVHYIASAGFDCEELPIYCAPFDNFTGAVEQLRAIYDLDNAELRTLSEDHMVELDITKHGIGYAAIEECACEDGDEHVG